MSDGLSFQVEGIDDFLKEVRKLEQRAQRRAILKVLRSVGRVMVRQAKKNAPVGELNDGFHKKGNLRRSIGMKNLTRLGIHNLAVLVGPRLRGGRYKGYHGILVEKGTKAHAIALKRSGKKYKHKGAKAQNFFEQAMISIESLVESEYEKLFREILYG